MTKYFRNSVTGKYIGGFDGAEPDASDNPVICPVPGHGSDIWDGSAWVPYVQTSEEIEARIQQNTNDIVENDEKFRVMAALIFDTLKAGKTGDYSAFDGVTDKASFKAHVADRFRANG